MKILIISACNKNLIDILESNGFECHLHPNISDIELTKQIYKFEGIISNNKIVFSKLIIDKSENLKFIGWIGAGLENIDTEYAEKKGIIYLDAPEGSSDAVGEHALAMLLNLFNNLCRANMQVKNGIWKSESNKGIEVGGKTIGIIGYGNTGRAFAKRLSGFNAKILSYDKYLKSYGDAYCQESSMEDIYKFSDILSLHIPLTKETYNLVDYQFLKKFKKNIYLINTSRGAIVKTDDLAKSIQASKVLGAALDVLEYEKTSFEKLHFSNMPESLQFLIDNDNVILSPHIAGWTKESDVKTASILAEKIVKAFKPVE
jgi:D-3-phosphoglycerate dehydrogenase / 2-oxoglutarate reductase